MDQTQSVACRCFYRGEQRRDPANSELGFRDIGIADPYLH